MNILFFLTPKEEVAFIYDDFSLRQALEKMERHRYAAVPIITRSGQYAGTLTEGDLLWGIKNRSELNLRHAEHLPISRIPHRADYKPVHASTSIDELLQRAVHQNFVPVVDDRGVFIGIITRSRILQYFCKDVLRTSAAS